MQAKYVSNRDGEFVIASSSLGYPHPMLSSQFLSGVSETSAGFVYIDEDTQMLVTYGRSTGLNLAHSQFDAMEMDRAYRDRKMVIVPLGDGQYYATNRAGAEGEVVTDLAMLAERGIITE